MFVSVCSMQRYVCNSNINSAKLLIYIYHNSNNYLFNVNINYTQSTVETFFGNFHISALKFIYHRQKSKFRLSGAQSPLILNFGTRLPIPLLFLFSHDSPKFIGFRRALSQCPVKLGSGSQCPGFFQVIRMQHF